MNNYIIMQYPYELTEIALCQNGTINTLIREDKFSAVSLTIPNIQNLLQQNNVNINNIDFIGVNTGPGPYNTLRALITTANGIHFAKKIPLVNLSALDLLLSEHEETPTLAVLNAFANHVFYAFSTADNKEQGYCSIDNLIHKINQQSELVTLVGNGVKLYLQQFLEGAKFKIIIPQEIPLFNDIKTLATHAYQAYQSRKIESSFLMPTYLHSPAIKSKP